MATLVCSRPTPLPCRTPIGLDRCWGGRVCLRVRSPLSLPYGAATASLEPKRGMAQASEDGVETRHVRAAGNGRDRLHHPVRTRTELGPTDVCAKGSGRVAWRALSDGVVYCCWSRPTPGRNPVSRLFVGPFSKTGICRLWHGMVRPRLRGRAWRPVAAPGVLLARADPWLAVPSHGVALAPLRGSRRLECDGAALGDPPCPVKQPLSDVHPAKGRAPVVVPS